MKMWLVITLGAAALAAVLTIAFLRLYPPFGGRPSTEQLLRRHRSERYDANRKRFAYPLPTPMNMGVQGMLSTVWEMIKGQPLGRPAKPIEVAAYEPQQPEADGETGTSVTWFGHSAVLIETDGKRLFIDPMLGRAPSPVPAVGGRRFSDRLPAQIEELPRLDAVLLSHDHYDHLDYGT